MERRLPHPRHDPIRQAYEVAADRFSLGGRLDPVAIRDQMVRACLVVDRMVEAEIIKPDPAPPLAVIGAGAAGVTAALRAASYGVTVFVLSSSGKPFHHQADCRSRRLDPTLYDWPAPHWEAGVIPLANTPHMPLGWKGESASAVANSWAEHWPPPLNDPLVHSINAEVEECQARNGKEIILGINRKDIEIPPFAAVIDATGQGHERTCVHDEHPAGACNGFRGMPFWQRDVFEDWNYGQPEHNEKDHQATRPSILLGGAGDGALQDLLRLTLAEPSSRSAATPFSTKSLFQEVRRTIEDERGTGAWREFVAAIAAGEDQAARASLSVGHDGQRFNRDQEYRVLERLENVYINSLDRLLGARNRVSPKLSELMERWQRRDLGTVILVYRGPTFGRCYPVNRLLAHLLMRYYAPMDEDASVHFRKETRIDDVIPVAGYGHTCNGDHTDCLWQPHQAIVNGTTEPREFDLVILRHGVLPKKDIPGLPPVAVARHLLPYHLP